MKSPRHRVKQFARVHPVGRSDARDSSSTTFWRSRNEGPRNQDSRLWTVFPALRFCSYWKSSLDNHYSPLSIRHSLIHLSVQQQVSSTSSQPATEAIKVKWDDPCPCGMPATYQALGLAWGLEEMSHVQLLPFRDSLAIEGDLQGSQPNQKRELQRAVGAQRSGRQEEIPPRREALVGLSGWLVALGLCRCTRASSLVVARRGSSLIAAHRLLIAVASLVAEHRL